MKSNERKMHYIAMSGDHGYLPDHCEVYEDLQGAVDDLVSLFEIGRNRARRLKQDQYLELNTHRDGAEYCEINECDCEDMSIHSGSQ